MFLHDSLSTFGPHPAPCGSWQMSAVDRGHTQASTGWLGEGSRWVSNPARDFPACENRLWWIECTRPIVGPTAKKTVSAHTLVGSEGLMGLMNLGRRRITLILYFHCLVRHLLEKKRLRDKPYTNPE